MGVEGATPARGGFSHTPLPKICSLDLKNWYERMFEKGLAVKTSSKADYPVKWFCNLSRITNKFWL